jgi:hypothetical protein
VGSVSASDTPQADHATRLRASNSAHIARGAQNLCVERHRRSIDLRQLTSSGWLSAMLWTTRSQLHLDRAACVWLVRRFIDPHAEFAFVGWEDQPPTGPDAPSFGIPGCGVGAHDASGTAFIKLARRHALDDPALAAMDRIIASGVADALGTEPPPDQTEEERLMGVALNRLGSALSVAYDDHSHVDAAVRIYEGVHAMCQVGALSPEQRAQVPRRPPARVAYLRQAIGR